jgi:hypothetical protein
MLWKLVGDMPQQGVVATDVSHQPFVAATPTGVSRNGQHKPPEYSFRATEDSKSDHDKEATRYLSAATQLDLRYAEFVVRQVVGEPVRALAPAAGADSVIVARWALAALRRRMQRNVALTCVLTAGLVLTFLLWSWVPLAAMAVLGMAVTALERWVRYHQVISGQLLRDRFDLAAAPDSHSPASEQRLEVASEQQGGNLVVFQGRSAFVGSGRRVLARRMVINVGIGKRGKDGKRRTPVVFETQELHTAMAQALERMGLADLHVEERLYVNGQHISGNPEILPDELRPPATSVSRELLEEGARHPTPDARTYVCAEMRGWQGQLVVSLFARAIQANGSLHIEWSFYVLPPLAKVFLEIDKYYEQPPARQLLGSALAGMVRGVPALVSSPVYVVRNMLRPVRDRARKQRQEYRIKHGQVFNYGAPPSIRQYAWGLTERHYFLARDHWTYVYLAEHTLLKTIEAFLVNHKIDLEMFTSQQNTFIKLVSNTNVDEINAENVAVGSKNKITSEKK